MTFQQKNTVVTLATFSLILTLFLMRLMQLIQGDNFTQPTLVRLWLMVVLLAVVATIAALILTHGVSAAILAIRTNDGDPEYDDLVDDRDRFIDLKGTRLTYTVTSLGSFLAMLTFALGQSALIMFTLLVFFGLVAQIAGDVRRLHLYSQG